MRKRPIQLPAALKHGVYSNMTLLPSEDPAAFDELHNSLIAEYVPTGRHEQHLVEELARLIWRKQNLLTYELVKRAKSKHSSIYDEANAASSPRYIVDDIHPSFTRKLAEPRDPEEIRALYKAAHARARKELGPARDLVYLGDVGSDHLLKELEIHERLDGMIDRVLKRLLFVRGLKSLSSAQPPASLPHIRQVS